MNKKFLAFCIILYCCGSNFSSPVRYSYLSILPDENRVIFAADLLISYCNFSSLVLSSVVVTILYTSSSRFFQKCNGLSDGRVASITKHFFSLHFLYSTFLDTFQNLEILFFVKLHTCLCLLVSFQCIYHLWYSYTSPASKVKAHLSFFCLSIISSARLLFCFCQLVVICQFHNSMYKMLF